MPLEGSDGILACLHATDVGIACTNVLKQLSLSIRDAQRAQQSSQVHRACDAADPSLSVRMLCLKVYMKAWHSGSTHYC